MPRIHVVTMLRLNRALARVQTELDRHGLWNERLHQIEVYLVPLGTAYGWQAWRGDGSISIPRVSLSRLRDLLTGSYCGLADVLRHEYGHALADAYRVQFRSRRFRQVFGASIESEQSQEYAPERHVTEYAATNACEDFSESFMYYLRHGGRLPARHDTPAIRRKWRFVAELCTAIRRGRTRW